MNIISVFLSFFLFIKAPSLFECDSSVLKATIRNNLNGDFSITTNLDKIDQGAFVNLEWKNLSLMLPISFQANEISFTDKKWIWSYRDKENGLHEQNPRLARRLPNGNIIEYECHSLENNTDRIEKIA